MSDYKEQVNSLREHADLIETSIELYGPSATRLLVYDLRNAAAAIEELEDALADECSENDYLVNENTRLTAENKELQAQLPKRGEMKNADKIRAMTDEELAKWVTSYGIYFGEEYEGYMSCLDWLREEVQE